MAAPALLHPHPVLHPYYRLQSHKPHFLRHHFDAAARDYDAVENLLSLGSGSRYRRDALIRAGLAPGMAVLDVAVGTGLVARQAIAITGNPNLILGIDPSPGMIAHAVRASGIRAVIAIAESIPLPDHQFDFLSMGYALRHLSDIHRAFAEFHRVLKPGGHLCLLEITAPRRRIPRAILRAHMRLLIPILTRITTGRPESQTLWRHYWDTIEACLDPQLILDALTQAGFTQVCRHVTLGIFSEYTAAKPA